MNPLETKHTAMMLRTTPADYDFDWHCAPRRQFIVNLDAAVDVETGDGCTTRFQSGELFYVEDVVGKGHRSKAVGGAVRHSVFLAVAPEFHPHYDDGTDGPTF